MVVEPTITETAIYTKENGKNLVEYFNLPCYRRLNRKHGFGIQIYAKEGRKYVGKWSSLDSAHFCRTLARQFISWRRDPLLPWWILLHWYANLRPAKLKLIGHFLEGDKNGKGVFHDSQDDDYEEEWVGGEMFRRAPVSPMRKHSSSAVTNFTAAKRGRKKGCKLKLKMKK